MLRFLLITVLCIPLSILPGSVMRTGYCQDRSDTQPNASVEPEIIPLGNLDGENRLIKLDLTTSFRPRQQSPAQFVETAIRRGCQAVVVGAPAPTASPKDFRDFRDQVGIARIVQPAVPIFVALEWTSIERAWVIFANHPELGDSVLFDRFPVGLTSPELGEDATPHLTAQIDRLIEFCQSTSLKVLVLVEPRATGSRLADLISSRIENAGGISNVPALSFRWTTADALPGRTWDQQISLGRKGASVANSVDGLDLAEIENPEPGEFSATLVPVKNNTQSEIIEAIANGSAMGIQGRSVANVQFEVTCRGLRRGARPGETVVIPVGMSVEVLLSFDSVRDPIRSRWPTPDSVELVRNEKGRIPQIVTLTPIDGNRYRFEFAMPPSEVSFRVVGNSQIKSTKLPSFFTNPVFLIPREAAKKNSAQSSINRLFGHRRPEFWIGIGLATATLFSAVLLGIYLLVVQPALLRKKRSAASSKRSKQKSEEAASAGKSATAPPTPAPLDRTSNCQIRSRLAIAALVIASLIAYGSLVPFHTEQKSWQVAFGHFITVRTTPQHFFRPRADRLINIAITIPLAFFAVGALAAGQKNWRRWLVALPTAVVLSGAVSIAVEFAQEWFPDRVPSMNDLICQAIGIAIGATAWLTLGESLTRRWQRAAAVKYGRAEFALGMMALLVAGFSALPVAHPVSSVQDVTSRLTQWETVPFRSVKSAAKVYQDAFESLVSLVPLGMWIALRQRRVSENPNAVRSAPAGQVWLISMAWCAISVMAIYLLRFLLTENGGRAEMLLWGCAGAALGAFVILQPPARWTIRVSTLIFLGLLCGYTLLPWNFQPGDQPFFDRLLAGAGLPFAKFHAGDDLNMIDQTSRKLGWFAAIGVLTICSQWTSSRVVALLLAIFCGCAVGFIGEAGQSFLPTRTPDLTDIVIGAVGSLIGSLATTYVIDPAAPAKSSAN